MKQIRKRSWLGIVAAVLLLLIAGTALGLGGDGYVEAAPAAQTAPKASAAGAGSDQGSAQVHFIDVGQGDATLIQCGEHAMLIDAGENDKGTAIQLYLKKQGVQKLDYLVLTHPDADHIGGADVIITKFPIGKVMMSDYRKTNQTYREVIEALQERKKKWSVPEPGEVYSLGGAKFTILAPCESYADPNNSSIALLFVNGKNRFLFTGDAEEEAETDMRRNGLSLQADVYKAGHHGSDTASSSLFLKAVKPKYAVISCSEGNSYGHPHAAVLNELRAMGVQVFRTDEQGSIIATSDGKEIRWNCAPSTTWQSGEKTGSAFQKRADTQGSYIGNRNNGKLHRSLCKKLPKAENQVHFADRQSAIAAGYDDPCKLCKP